MLKTQIYFLVGILIIVLLIGSMAVQEGFKPKKSDKPTTTPSNTAPSNTAPSNTAPSNTAPSATTPSATTPSATTPSATTPSATTPSATTPSATTPSNTTPSNTTSGIITNTINTNSNRPTGSRTSTMPITTGPTGPAGPQGPKGDAGKSIDKDQIIKELKKDYKSDVDERIKNHIDTINDAISRGKMVEESLKTENKTANANISNFNKQKADIKNVLDATIAAKTEAIQARDQGKQTLSDIKKEAGTVVNHINNKKVGDAIQNVLSSKKQAFSTMETDYNSAYSGKLMLEGFTDGYPNYDSVKGVADAESNINTKYNTFMGAYYTYTKCVVQNGQDYGDCKTKLTDLQTSATILNTAINDSNLKSNNNETHNNYRLTTSTSQTDPNANAVGIKMDTVVQTADYIQNLRSDLDMKMADLLDKKSMVKTEAESKFTTTQYAAIGWSILAAGSLFYVFTELD